MPTPAVVALGAAMVTCVAFAAVTVMVPLVPVIVPWVAVIVLLPAVVKVALKLPTPAVSGLAAGSLVERPVSVLEKVTLPLKLVAVLLNWSSATTVNSMLLPALVAD